jgi:hypothetical protein
MQVKRALPHRARALQLPIRWTPEVEGLVVGEEFLAPRCAMVRAQTEAQAIITAQPLRRMAGTRNFLPGP